MRLKIVLSVLLGMSVWWVSAQQRPLTSTYPYNGLLINPAFAGSVNKLSVTGVHRKQWINIEGAPTFSALTAHTTLNSDRIGVGLQVGKDVIGVTEDTYFYGSYAYKINTKVGVLSMGIQGGFNNRKSDFNQLELLDDEDPFLSGMVTRFSPNFGTGLFFSNENFYAGVSIPYLIENKTIDLEEITLANGESTESRIYYITSGYVMPLGSNMKFSPSFLIRAQEQNRLSWDITANVIFDDIAYVGVNYRNSGDIVFIGQLILNENFRVGYAYDANTSELAPTTAGSHEILLNYRIKIRNNRKNPVCPVYLN
jgi:type IX secretion system PorP/SprF family membrane protein